MMGPDPSSTGPLEVRSQDARPEKCPLCPVDYMACILPLCGIENSGGGTNWLGLQVWGPC